MSTFELILLAVSVAMDAFAVSIAKGISVSKLQWSVVLIPAAYFGFFQMLMPLTGYFLGNSFRVLIVSIDHWIAFLLLAFIGGKMILETIHGEEVKDGFGFSVMLPLAIATSIDAMAVGVTISLLNERIWLLVLLTGAVTFLLSGLGVYLGNRFGKLLSSIAGWVGGIVLILIGLKILIEHLFFGA